MSSTYLSMLHNRLRSSENRRGKKIERRKKKPQDENIMSASAMQGGHVVRQIYIG